MRTYNKQPPHTSSSLANIDEAGILDDLAVDLAGRRGGAAIELLGSVLADPATLVAVAEAEGVIPADFQEEDVRLLWCAGDVARHRPILTILRLARFALRGAGWWDPKGSIHRGTCCLWNDESLALIAESYPPSEDAVRANARELLALSRRWRMAETLLSQLRETLSAPGPARRDVPAPAFRPVIVNAQGRRGERGAA